MASTKRDRAELISRASEHIDEISRHIKDLDKESAHLSRLKQMHQEKKEALRRGGDEARILADVWDYCGKEIAILERDLVITEIDPEEIAYNLEQKKKDAVSQRDAKLTAEQQTCLKDLLVAIKMFYFLLKEELVNLRKNSIDELRSSIREQDKYLQNIIDLSISDIRQSKKKKENLELFLRKELESLMDPSWMSSPYRQAGRMDAKKALEEMSKKGLTSLISSGKLVTAAGIIRKLILKGKPIERVKAESAGSKLRLLKKGGKLNAAMSMLLASGRNEIYMKTKALRILRSADILKNLIIESIRQDGVELPEASLKRPISDMIHLFDTVKDDDTVALAINKLIQSPDGALIVDEGGIIQLQDIIDKCILKGKHIDHLKVASVKSKEIISAQATTPITDSIFLMLATGADVLEIKNNSTVIGHVSLKKILKAQELAVERALELVQMGARISSRVIASKHGNDPGPILLSFEYFS